MPVRRPPVSLRKKNIRRTALLFGLAALFGLAVTVSSWPRPAAGGDWPQWRHDAGHTASTPDALPENLHLRWVRHLPKQQTAWPASQVKLRFDASYEPVVAGKRMFVGSTVDDSLTAYDTDTGAELWRFFTDAPIRFAPIADSGRVYVTSDDGHLYCLSADNGSLIWKVNGGPINRPIIGNHRLISSWPIRGGAVLNDGVIYFAAGIWPTMGIFIHAVDAETGRFLWTNSKTGSKFTVHPHGASSFGSIVPQGHFAFAGNRLIVPGGRSLPAILDPETGDIVHFDFGGKSSGGCNVMVNDDVYVVRNALFRLKDGLRLDTVRASVLDGKNLIGAPPQTGPVNVQTWAGKTKVVTIKDRRGRSFKRVSFVPHEKWTIARDKKTSGKVFLKAGNRIYTAGKGTISAWNANRARKSQDKQSPVWTTKLEGTVGTMLAADNKLFVVTLEGTIACFGRKSGQPKTYQQAARPLENHSDGWSNKVQALLKLEGTSEGYAIALGIGSGRLIEELLKQSKLHVIAIDADAARVDQFREKMQQAGLYGTRFVAHVGSIKTFNFPPYLANLIVSENSQADSFDNSTAALQALYRPLRPYGGVVAFSLAAEKHDAFARAVVGASLAQANVKRYGDFSLLTREGALPGSDSWTHHYGDSTNRVVSKDTLVKTPLGVLWFGGPSNDKILPRHGHGPSPQVAGGRLFIEGPDMIRAVDVYTGRVVWERDLKDVGKYYNVTSHFPGASEIGSNYVSLPDAVYVVYGDRILELDAINGHTKKEFTLAADADGKRPNWGSVVVRGDLLIATSGPVSVVDSQSKAKPVNIPEGFRLLIKPKAKWRYLAGSDPKENWTAHNYNDKSWKQGKAGFGFADGDDETILRNMRGKYQRVYLRKTFDSRALANVSAMALMINFDDAFIAYLNGKEIARANVVKRSGSRASGIGSHEASGHALFEIDDIRKLLRPGKNVIAIEGHNEKLSGGDFTLDPYVIFGTGKTTVAAAQLAGKKPPKVRDVIRSQRYSSASRHLVVFNRHTGKMLWSRDAEYNFRHNAVIASDDTVFCIDGMSPQKAKSLKRRGIDPKSNAKLFAFDSRTGDEKWSTSKNVFGTFLNYSAEHDILLQAGSANRDRAQDEVGKGMIAYRGRNGKIIWKDLAMSYGGPCVLWRDKIITNGSSGYQIELATGKRTGWKYSRMYGCNTIIGSEHLLTFRSGAAGFCDLTGNSGTGNIGGFRSSCTSNLIAADGVLSAPDFTRTCQCAYQNQTSLAFIHMPDIEVWTFNATNNDIATKSNSGSKPLRVGINLGAPGDRRSSEGTLWYEYPTIGGPSPKLPIEILPKKTDWFTRHSSRLKGDGMKWIAASGGKGIESIKITLNEKSTDPKPYRVRLYFAEPENIKPGDRVFNVTLAGQTRLENFDILAEAGGPNRTVVKEFRGVRLGKHLKIELKPTLGAQRKPAILCGIEVVAEDE